MRVVLALIVALALSVGASWGENLLRNPGFEEVDANGRAVGWTHGPQAETVTDATIAHSGQRCAKTNFDNGLAQRFPVEGGATYRITGWIRRIDPNGVEVPKIKVYFIPAEGGETGATATEFSVPAEGWVPWESIVRTPVGTVTMNVTLRGFFGGSEFFYWDDLAVERIEAPDWPAWDSVPDLHGMTVTVPDLADVRTDVVYRWFSQALWPMDGTGETSVLLKGQPVTVQLGRESTINYLLVHTLQPAQTLRRTRVVGLTRDGEQELLVSGEPTELVYSARFAARSLTGLRLEPPADATVCLNEIQLFSLEPTQAELPGQADRFTLTAAQAPEPMRPHLQRALGEANAGTVLLAGAAPAGGGPVELAPTQALSILYDAPPTEYAVSGVDLELALRSAQPQTQVEITVMQVAELDLDYGEAELVDRAGGGPGKIPAGRREPRLYSALARVLSRIPESGKLMVRLDLPDTVYAAGEPVWLVIRPQRTATLDPAASALTGHTIPVAQALADYLPRLQRTLIRLYAQGTEARAWGNYRTGYIGHYIRRVLELDPNNLPAQLIWNHVGGRRMNVKLTRPGPADAPEWAVWAHLALNNMQYWIDWWLDNRQRPDGQLGGHINDDGEFSCRWPVLYLITGQERIADALQKLANVAWAMSGGKGYTVGSRDVEHAAEDQSCTQPQVLLTRYGSPQAMERLMKMSTYLDFWTAINEVGRRQFKSFMFTHDQIWGDPPDDVDQAYCPLAMVGAGHAVWYANLPELKRIFLEEADSWRLATESTDKGKRAGVIPGEIKFSNSEILPYMPYNSSNPVLKNRPALYIGGGIYIVEHLLRGATWLTGDPKYAGAMELAAPSDEERVKLAEAALSQYLEEVLPPPPGPEKRHTVRATEAQTAAPIGLVRNGEAIGSATSDGQAGEATITVAVPEAGRYAVWASLGRTDPADPAGPASFFVEVDGAATDRIVTSIATGAWGVALSQRTYQLTAGEHTIRIRPRTAGSAVREIGFTNKYSLDGTWSAGQDETRLYQAWRITGDRKWLIEELKEVIRQQERTRWLMTEAEPFTDRIIWPGDTLLALTYLGGTTAQKSHVPGHWISWEGGGTNFAALVLDAQRDHLKVLCYSFAAQPVDMKMRVWRLPHGRYSVNIGVDRNDDWAAEEAVSRTEMELARFDAVSFTARPATQYVIELSLLQELDDITSRPDLALDPWDVVAEDGAIKVTVHNIGGAAAPATVARLFDATGKVVGEAQVPALEAPLDLKPRTATVTIPLTGRSQPGWRVLLDADNTVAEITEVNNSATVGW